MNHVKSKKRSIGMLLFVLIFVSTASQLWAINAEEIIRKMEENQVHGSSYSEGKLLVEDRFGIKESTFRSWSQGEDKMLLEFTSRAERGQKILRTEDEIYLYFPDADDLIRLQGAALRDSVLGSDLSYEDMTGDKGILDSYQVSLLGEEEVDGFPCYKIELKATSRDVPYPREIMWVDSKLFVFRRVHRFSLSGRLLKEMQILGLQESHGKIFPVRMLMEDAMKSNSSTEFIMTKVEIDIDLPEDIFSLRELSW